MINHCYKTPVSIAACLHWLCTAPSAVIFEDCVEESVSADGGHPSTALCRMCHDHLVFVLCALTTAVLKIHAHIYLCTLAADFAFVCVFVCLCVL